MAAERQSSKQHGHKKRKEVLPEKSKIVSKEVRDEASALSPERIVAWTMKEEWEDYFFMDGSVKHTLYLRVRSPQPPNEP